MSNINPEYKTKICQNFFTKGYCGNRDCFYAHSVNELRPKNWSEPGMTQDGNGRWYNPYAEHVPDSSKLNQAPAQAGQTQK